VLRCQHPDTVLRIHNLGSVLSGQGKYEEAELMCRRAFEGYEEVLRIEHPRTLSSANNLGTLLSCQGKYEEAEAIYRQALGVEHPDTLTSVNNLGSVLSKQGQYEEAELMHRRTLEAREKVVGREDSSISGHSMTYLFPHSARSDYVVVPLPGMQANSGSSTALYLISEPLPVNISILELNITSHDQGFCNDPNRGSWTWFEVSIIRAWCEEPDSDFEDLKHNTVLKSHPEDFGDSIQERGWYFANIPVPDGRSTGTDSISRKIIDNPVSRQWSVNRVSWSKEDFGGDFVSLL
jgi:tetratricopeptide (TPR) repeat protein